MRTIVRIFVGIAAYGTFMINSVIAQERLQIESLDAVLRRSVSERIGGPLVFSTRDSLFALSLPTDEPATIYLQLTVGKNGKVKDKQTKVHANHMAQYVAPAFVEATKGLRVDRTLLEGMQRKDTALVVAFPIEYCHVLDTTINNTSRAQAHPYRSESFSNYMIQPWIKQERASRQFSPNQYFAVPLSVFYDNPYTDSPALKKSQLSRRTIGFYIAFIMN